MSTSPDPQFADLGLAPELLAAVESLGYETPSPIQAGAIPPLLAGRDMIGQAHTGTGKTAAFALPMLQRLDLSRRDVQAIVLTPTRELAMQVAAAVRGYGRGVGKHGVQVLPVYGGQPIHVQRKALQRTVHVVIGTPGRVADHLRRGTLDLSGVHFFCLDEADEMLNMGFLDDVEWILDHAPATRQIALFSATMPPPIRRVAKKHLDDPVDVRVAHETKTVENIEQASLRVSRHNKNEALERILGVEDHEAVLIFVGTQRAAAGLAEYLQSRGFGAECIHGGMNQSQRDTVVKRLRGRRIQILVATDVAARGLDVDHIGLVINYDLPRDPEVYVHRVGRTARAGRSGHAISLWQPREQRLLRSIERFSGQPMASMRIPAVEELLARQRVRTVEKLQGFDEEELGDFAEWAGEIAGATGWDPIHLAAAALRLAWGDSPLRAPAQPPPRERPRREGRSRDGGPPRRDHAPRVDMVEIVIPVGHHNGVRPGAIVGMIAGETGLPGTIVGRINLRERVTFVEVAAEHVDMILNRLRGVRIGGRTITPRLAHPPGGHQRRGQRPGSRGPHRPHRGPRPDRPGHRPRKPHHRGRGPAS